MHVNGQLPHTSECVKSSLWLCATVHVSVCVYTCTVRALTFESLDQETVFVRQIRLLNLLDYY